MTSGGSPYPDLLGGPPPTLLPPDPGAAALEAGTQAEAVAAQYPGSCAAWAALADQAWHAGDVVQSYAFARTGYHRGLDALRRSGWKGHGPVPWSHEPNRGWLRALHALGRAAHAIGEGDEAERCAIFLVESSPEAADVLTSA
ncbi:MAG TPA: DUF3151 domain-containing protein [Actinomycetes bacterium]|nr:DUF3151 domain-containing protein [Actinomycetes bacterium]